ncbi:MAG: hypothetical protein KDE51_08320 [Anaerolineales bacterium]|nr:hypothetical protein [Anaerolineales bacterium]
MSKVIAAFTSGTAVRPFSQFNQQLRQTPCTICRANIDSLQSSAVARTFF